MKQFDKFCQSCGMPLEKDTEHGGTNADGSKSLKFCSHCYTQGVFNDKFTHSKEMVNFVKDKLKEMGYGPLKRWFFTINIPQLERWKS